MQHTRIFGAVIMRVRFTYTIESSQFLMETVETVLMKFRLFCVSFFLQRVQSKDLASLFLDFSSVFSILLLAIPVSCSFTLFIILYFIICVRKPQAGVSCTRGRTIKVSFYSALQGCSIFGKILSCVVMDQAWMHFWKSR